MEQGGCSPLLPGQRRSRDDRRGLPASRSEECPGPGDYEIRFDGGNHGPFPHFEGENGVGPRERGGEEADRRCYRSGEG